MRLTINGVNHQVEDGKTVLDAVRLLGIDESDGIAAAVEGEVIPRKEWEATRLNDGQHIEVLRAVQGG